MEDTTGYGITFFDMVEHRCWLNTEMIPTPKQVHARQWEDEADALTALKRCKADRMYGILFRDTAQVVALPYVDEDEASASRVADAIFSRGAR